MCHNTLEDCFFEISFYSRAYVRIIYEKINGQVSLGPLVGKTKEDWSITCPLSADSAKGLSAPILPNPVTTSPEEMVRKKVSKSRG